MSRKLMAVLVCSTLVFGNISTSAWSAADAAQTAQITAAAATENVSPLPPAGAAGIKEAQGIENSALLGLGLVAAIVLVAWLLIDNEGDNEETPTTGT